MPAKSNGGRKQPGPGPGRGRGRPQLFTQKSSLLIHLEKRDHEAIKRAAKKAGKKVGEWAREKLLGEI